MSNITSLVLSSRFLMPNTSTSSGRGNIRLNTRTPVMMPCRHLDAPGRCINSMRCSATHAPILLPTSSIDAKARQAHDAAVLAIGTANPTNCLPLEEYADWYFRVTKSEHLGQLKAKMERICKKSGIKKRYFFPMEDRLLKHPELVDRARPSLDARHSIVASTVPELAAAAAARAIAEWGHPAADITHLVFATSSGAHMPGADLRLASLLGLRPTVQRTMMYMTGCSAASAVLRVAKDIAENNHGTRVLVAAADDSLIHFRAPHQDHPETLVVQALVGDGAGAAVVGSVVGSCGDANGSGVEHPLFEMVSASQTVVPNTEDAAAGKLTNDGLAFCPSPKMPELLRRHVEQCLVDAVTGPLGSISPGGSSWSWNDLFWAVRPGGPAILDSVQAALALAPGKLAASRHVLAEFGNLAGASVFFVLDELRRRPDELELEGGIGVMLGLGPGVTVETMVLRAASGLSSRKRMKEIDLKGIQADNA